MKKLYYIIIRFMNSHTPILVGISDDPVEFIMRFADQNGYIPTDFNTLVEHRPNDAHCEYLWIGTNYSKLDCKIIALEVKPTGVFWLDLTGDARYAILSR